MAVAKLYPEPAERGRGKKDLKIKDFNAGAVSQARTVLKHLPEMAKLVLEGAMSLNGSPVERVVFRKVPHVLRDALSQRV